jgi:PadR family transcriptional regulator PadR
MKRLEAKGCGALSLKEGTVYPILYRLEHSGFVRAAWDADTTTSRGPRRRVYHITSRGRRELAKRRKQWDQFVGTVGRLIEAPQ